MGEMERALSSIKVASSGCSHRVGTIFSQIETLLQSRRTPQEARLTK